MIVLGAVDDALTTDTVARPSHAALRGLCHMATAIERGNLPPIKAASDVLAAIDYVGGLTDGFYGFAAAIDSEIPLDRSGHSAIDRDLRAG